MKAKKPYPSDISREQFEVIRLQLACFRRVTKPHQYELYDIFCGILYVLKSGCKWSILPHDYPLHHTVYNYFRQWGAKPFADQPSLLGHLQQQLLEAEREADGREKNDIVDYREKRRYGWDERLRYRQKSVGHQAAYCG
jgi:transposase